MMLYSTRCTSENAERDNEEVDVPGEEGEHEAERREHWATHRDVAAAEMVVECAHHWSCIEHTAIKKIL